MSDVTQDVRFMRRALRLAAKGRGLTTPNPMVGAVVVANGQIVGSGFHRRAGGLHAEMFALQEARTRARGATLYATLEPCSHTKKRTPPCVPAIIASGLKRVVVAMRDPNPQVSGRGIRQLRRAGLLVETGCLRTEAEALNEVYTHWIRTGRPFVILKAATTLDGKIATARGESQWITGHEARRHVHRLRSQVEVILVGIGTVLKDDPQLTVRLAGNRVSSRTARRPLRIILDSQLNIPLTARVLSGGEKSNVLVATTNAASASRIAQLRAKGIAVWVLPKQNGHVSLRACLTRLGRLGLSTVMIEGGSELNAGAIRAGLVNRVMVYVAPRLLGGQDAKGMIGGHSPVRLVKALTLAKTTIRRVGKDFLITGDFPNS